jgi:splicing factor U2AF subunit
MVNTLQMTKHARRLYVGGVPPALNEADISSYFNDTIALALAPKRLDSSPVLSVYINKEKCFAFVELSSVELTTACCQLDGIAYNRNGVSSTFRIRRPNDYRPETLPPNIPPPPTLNMAALGIVSTTVADGPNKMFIGGLPYHLTEENVKELLSAFGPLKSFHLVKDAGSVTSKGYAFCEYVDPANMIAASNGLNGLPIGDKVISIRLNNAGIAGTAAPAVPVVGAPVAPYGLPAVPATRVSE